jgi:hypothetical protein
VQQEEGPWAASESNSVVSLGLRGIKGKLKYGLIFLQRRLLVYWRQTSSGVRVKQGSGWRRRVVRHGGPNRLMTRLIGMALQVEDA